MNDEDSNIEYKLDSDHMITIIFPNGDSYKIWQKNDKLFVNTADYTAVLTPTVVSVATGDYV